MLKCKRHKSVFPDFYSQRKPWCIQFALGPVSYSKSYAKHPNFCLYSSLNLSTHALWLQFRLNLDLCVYVNKYERLQLRHVTDLL